ncbi:hypothetical protein EMPS_08725 [Entomortierella parvispora]|uniref:Uncharacterized protein n=1 Tax=Entomortierella parvispora TaxID=205924 RepID=A0A9P3HGW0_9FUNG|nr:hypothetical protein EMPS_08725 [Entomortierella parvispora]
MPALVYNPSRALRVLGLVSSAIVGLILLRAIFYRSPNARRSSRLRVEEPVVLILVHPSPSLSKAANFELKRSISRTWAKDVEDLGAGVFFVGEHDGETVMRRPSEFQGRAQSLSSRFGPEDSEADIEDSAAGGLNSNNEGFGFSKESSPMRKMLIPSVLENGQADDPPGLLKAYHFLYNNTNWYAGPIFDTYPFILTTDTTHYIHVENLVSTLLSSRPRRLLTMKDDQTFEGLVSEASACNPDDFGDKTSPLSLQIPGAADSRKQDESNTHWAMSRTHLVSKQLIAMVGPHLQRCIKESEVIMLDSGKAFYACITEWVSSPQFWRDGYCGRMSALRYEAPTPGSHQSGVFARALLSSEDRLSYSIRKERRDHPTSPEEFGAIYLKAQEEQAEVDLRTRQEHKKEEQYQREKQELRDRREKRSTDEDINSDDQQEDEDVSDKRLDHSHDRQGSLGKTDPNGQTEEVARSRWIVGSGLTQPIDFTLLHQSLNVGGEDEEDTEDADYY